MSSTSEGGVPRPPASSAHERIVEQIRMLMPVHLCAMSVLEGGGTLRVVADTGSVGFQGLECDRRLPPGAGVTGRAVAGGAPWWSPDVLHDPRIDLPEPLRSAVEESGLRALLAVPFRAQGRVAGALTVADTTPRTFEPHELTLLQAFGDHAAATLDNEQLAAGAAATEARYRELFEHASDIVFTLDLAGRLTSLNRAGERALGPAFREAGGHELGRALAAPVAFGTWIVRRLTQPGLTVHEPAVVTGPGTVVPLDVSLLVIRADGWPLGLLGIARDATERRRVEMRFVQAQRMETLGQLAAGIAHDFNDVLAVVHAQSQLVERQLESRHPVRPNLAMLRGAAERAIGLTRQLLALTRRPPLEVRRLDLNALVPPLLALMWPLLSRAAIVVETALAPDLGHVSADAGQLEQIITNLVLNARDAMPEGGRIAIATADVDVPPPLPHGETAIRPGRYVRLAVTDGGVGMTPQVRARAGEPFFTTKPSGEGTGLGLSAVYGIVAHYGGAVALDSEPGRGTAVSIYLPREAAPEE